MPESEWPEILGEGDRKWQRINTKEPPQSFRGFDMDALADESGEIGISPLLSSEELTKVLEHRELVLNKDWVAIEAKTGIRTSEAHLRELVKRCCDKVTPDTVLKAHGLPDLLNRLKVRGVAAPQGGSSPPRFPKPPQPASPGGALPGAQAEPVELRDTNDEEKED